MHIYRWDLDKTYLDTDFDSIRGLVRSATEPARAKRAVPGAAPLMRALNSRKGTRTFILSGSPTQMRDVIEEKLRLDGIRFDQLVLKDSLRHLRKGQVRMIRGQFGYKLPALLRARAGMGTAVRETLFGDDAEVDALVYSVYADVVAGRIGTGELSRIMEVAGAYPKQIERALRSAKKLPTCDAVQQIFIRLERRRPPSQFEPLGTRLIPVHSWWQAALVLLGRGQLDAETAGEVLSGVWASRGKNSWALAGLTQDVILRGHVDPSHLARLPLDEPLRSMFDLTLERLGPTPPLRQPAPPTEAVDYIGLIRGWTRH